MVSEAQLSHIRWAQFTTVRVALTVGALSVALSPTAGAQPLRGTVRDSLARPLVGADVILLSSGERSRSDSLGRFILVGPSSAGDTLRVRLIGYRPSEQRVVPADSARAVIIVLKRYPQMLVRCAHGTVIEIAVVAQR